MKEAEASGDSGIGFLKDARKVAMATSLAVSFLMLIGKLTAYGLTGSAAIFSDAAESVVHLLATGVAGISLWYASQPPDRQHPYGHGKIAYFSAGFEGSLICVAGIGIVIYGIVDLIRGPDLRQLDLGLLILGALTAVNLMLGLFLIRVGRRHNALVLIANGRHVLTDMWTSLGVVVGVGLVWLTGFAVLDPLLAILVGLNILWMAFRLMREAYEGLMDKVDPEATRDIVTSLDDARREGLILSYHHLRHRRTNDQIWVEVHLLFPDFMSVTEAHRRASMVEGRMQALFPNDQVLITSHLEPAEHEKAHPEGDLNLEDALRQSEKMVSG